MKRRWMQAGLMALGLVSAISVQVGAVEMGGFQIQVGPVQEEGMEIERNMQGEQEAVVTNICEEIPDSCVSASDIEAEEEVSTLSQPDDFMVSEAEERGDYQQENGESGQAETWEEPQVDMQSAEEAECYPDVVWQEESFSEIGRREMTEPEAVDSEPDIVSAQRMEEAEHAEEIREEKSEKKELGSKKSEKSKKESGVRLIHENFDRLSPEKSLGVCLEGVQEACVLSYTVNHKECACQWEGRYLLPVNPPLKKGINCLEVSLLLKNGQEVTMEPWLFSCGVGPAML